MDFVRDRLAPDAVPAEVYASPSQGARIMKYGDLVILYQTFENISFAFLTAGEEFSSRYGSFPHDSMVGMAFGSKIYSRTSKGGYIHVLSPTPELWSKVLPNRTQIVQNSDQSLIISRLDIKPGDIVIESGTGSGAMSTAIARSLGETGHLYTFEFHAERAAAAKEDFEANGIGHLVTVTHADVCGRPGQHGGFGTKHKGKVDAVFLDLPDPWLAVQHAYDALKPNRSLCSYSPCVEQVQKTCAALREAGFHSICTVELRQRYFNLWETEMDQPDWGEPQVEPVDEVLEDIYANCMTIDDVVVKDNGVNGQVKTSSESCPNGSTIENIANNDSGSCSPKATGKRQRECEADDIEGTNEGTACKRQRECEVDETERTNVGNVDASGGRSSTGINTTENAKKGLPLPGPIVVPTRNMSAIKAVSHMRGHTAFLTFATKEIPVDFGVDIEDVFGVPVMEPPACELQAP